jgi:hypothetical protein
MSGTASRPGGTGGSFPGFDAAAQAGHWDPVTAGVVLRRLGPPPDMRFFSPAEEAVANALCDRLVGQDGDPRVPVAALPTQGSANPALTIMAVAARAADQMAAGAGSGTR